MAIFETVRCDLCGYTVDGTDGDTCPNCGTDLVESNSPEPATKADVTLKVLDKRPVKSFKLRLAACDGPDGERLAALPEPWVKLEQLAQALDGATRKDVQNTLDMLTAGSLSMSLAEQDDPRCSVVDHFLRAVGKHLAVTLTDLRELERYIRGTAPHFPSQRSGESLAEVIGQIRDGLQSIRDGVPVSVGDSLDDLPRWEVNVQPVEPKHALHRTVCVQAPDPLTARMVALNVASVQWPGTDFTAISAVPQLGPPN